MAQEIKVRIEQAAAKHGRLFDRVPLVSIKLALQSPLVVERRARAECLLVRAEWPTLLRHLLGCIAVESVRDLTKFENEFPIKVTSDLMIRQDYFASGGGDHLKGIDGSSLVVVRLGMSAANKAVPLALFETLMMADDCGVPVWLVESAAKPFKEGHPSWAPDVQDVVGGWPRVDLVHELLDPKNVDVGELLTIADEGGTTL